MRPTREGTRYVLAVCLIALAALNTGNNLIYLIFAMMLSILVIAWAALLINMRGLSLTVSSPDKVFAAQQTVLNVSVLNAKRFFPSYTLRIVLPSSALLTDASSAMVAYVAAGAEVEIQLPVTFARRGAFRYGHFQVESGFPFIFFRKKIVLRVNGTVLVYPQLMDVHAVEGVSGATGDRMIMRRGLGDELLSLRAFQSGDELRTVHWKATAKSGALMVREHAQEQPRMATVVLDNTGRSQPEIFERAVSYAASTCFELIMAGYFVRLLICGRLMPFGSGLDHAYRMLDELAAVMEDEGVPCPLEDELEGYVIVVLKGPDSPLREIASLAQTVVDAATL